MRSNAQPLGQESWLWNFTKRLFTGVPVLAAVLALLAYGPWYGTALLVAASALYGLIEYRTLLAGRPGVALPLPAVLASGVLLTGGAMAAGAPGLHGGLVLAALLWFGVGLRTGQQGLEAALYRAGLGLFGTIWVPWLAAHLILASRLPQGGAWLLLLVVVLAGSDTCAYLVGSRLGRHRIAPVVSPSKTVEGALGGVAGGVAGGGLAWLWIDGGAGGGPPLSVLALCVVLTLLGQVGDLVESLVKRVAGARDSGRFMPGHGGLLDRMDAYLLAAPGLYYYLLFVR